MTETNWSLHEQPILWAGTPLGAATRAVLAIHGRGASASDIIGLNRVIDIPEFAWLAPDGPNHTWYPHSFLVPVERNQPYLDSALSLIDDLVRELGNTGIPPERVVLLGFSQGACLASEFVVRHPRQYGGLVVFSGGLIGASIDPGDYTGSLAGTPVFGGCSDIDPLIPLERFETTGQVLEAQGATVDFRVYPGMGHTISLDEVSAARELMAAVP